MFTVPAAIAREQDTKVASLTATNTTPKYAINIEAKVDLQVFMGDTAPLIGRVIVSNLKDQPIIVSHTITRITVNDSPVQIQNGNGVLLRGGRSAHYQYQLGAVERDGTGVVKFVVTVVYGHSEGQIDRSTVKELLCSYAVENGILDSRSSIIRDSDSVLPGPSIEKNVAV